MEIFIAILLATLVLLVGIIILVSRNRKARNKNFIHVSKRIDELERRI
mgnify:CR=1 FL=1|jgi:uncharacterized protein YneF (UPF0154 family)